MGRTALQTRASVLFLLLNLAGCASQVHWPHASVACRLAQSRCGAPCSQSCSLDRRLKCWCSCAPQSELYRSGPVAVTPTDAVAAPSAPDGTVSCCQACASAGGYCPAGDTLCCCADVLQVEHGGSLMRCTERSEARHISCGVSEVLCVQTCHNMLIASLPKLLCPAEPVRRDPHLPHFPRHSMRRDSILRACRCCRHAGSAACDITHRIAVCPAAVSGDRHTAGDSSHDAAAVAAAATAEKGAATACRACCGGDVARSLCCARTGARPCPGIGTCSGPCACAARDDRRRSATAASSCGRRAGGSRAAAAAAVCRHG